MVAPRSDEARRQAIQEAVGLSTLQPLFLDTETTGLESWDEIIEIGIVDFSGKVLLDTLIKPQGSIHADATRVHGISDRDVSAAPTWGQIWPQVERILDGQQVAIYNADYDVRMMQQSHARYRLNWQEVNFQPHCVMKLYAQYRGEWNPVRRSYRWHSLDSAGKQCGIPLSNTHRAKDDALLARAVLLYMAKS